MVGSRFDGPAVERYRPPELLGDIRLLDLLELSGTTVRASRWLNLSQPTVSRRYRALADDFGLHRDRSSLKRCRYGATNAIRLLRLGCRAHRLGAGVARIGLDLLHWHLLADCDWLLPAPVQFRSIWEWSELVRQGVLDGALVSGLELNATADLDTTGLRMLELGSMSLALGVHSPSRSSTTPIKAALVPHPKVAPGLHQALLNRGLSLKSAGNACITPRDWLQRVVSSQAALPLEPTCCVAGAWAETLQPQALSRALASPVWLVLPKGDGMPRVLACTLDHLKQHPALQTLHRPLRPELA